MDPTIMRRGNTSSAPERARDSRTGGETGRTGDGDTDPVGGDGDRDDDTEDTGVTDICLR